MSPGRGAPVAGHGGAASLVLVALLGLLWGFNWPAVRIALGEIPPWTLRAVGLLLGGLTLAGVAGLRGRSLSVRPAHWPRLALAGVLSIAAFNVLLAFAQLAAPTSRAAIVAFTMPIWAALLARFALGERFDRRRVAGLGLGVAGLVALGAPLLLAGRFQVGLLYALLAGVSWAAGTVVTKRFPVEAAPLAVAAWQLLVGAACAAAGMLAFEGLPWPWPLQGSTLLALAYHVLLAQALAYLLWFEVVARLPAGTAALGTLLVPAVGVLGAVLLLGERPTATDALGLLLVVGAAAAVLLPPRAKPVQAVARSVGTAPSAAKSNG
jgi:drug/metabolite transporter (DMT)-like permease